MTPGSLTKELRQFIALTANLGVPDGVRLALRELGVRTYQWVAYPGLERRRFEVQFDPVWRWIGRGTREQGLLRFAEEMVERGCTVFDIGAHLGESALLFSELVGPEGRVVAFEPDPVACASLRKNVEINGIKNTLVEELCVSDRTGKVLLATERFGSGASSIARPRSAGDHQRELEVTSTTIDEYARTSGLNPDWIKIDAEGAEGLIARGMKETVEWHHPGVMLEFHSDGLSEVERSEAWSTITQRASRVAVLESSSSTTAVRHRYLEELPKETVPERGFLIVYIEY